MRLLIAGLVVGAALAAGCSTTAGTPVAESTSATASHAASTSETTTTTAAKVAEPTGVPVGKAVMKVIGGSAPVTIRYRINGGEEQTEANVTLPWEKSYDVYNEVESEVSADGGSAELTCTITMDGDKLVSYKTEAKPVCNFAYWG